MENLNLCHIFTTVSVSTHPKTERKIFCIKKWGKDKENCVISNWWHEMKVEMLGSRKNLQFYWRFWQITEKKTYHPFLSWCGKFSRFSFGNFCDKPQKCCFNKLSQFCLLIKRWKFLLPLCLCVMRFGEKPINFK